MGASSMLVKGRLTDLQVLWMGVYPKVGDSSGYISRNSAFCKEILIGEGVTLLSDHFALNDGILQKRQHKSSGVVVAGDHTTPLWLT